MTTTLARTGLAVAPNLLAASTLIVVGAGLLALRRRRLPAS